VELYIALVHHPVTNKKGETVATAVTNLDIHDLARTARTYGVAGYLIVTPIAQQRSLVNRIVTHWQDGEGTRYNPARSKAFDIVSVVPDIEAAIHQIQATTGERPTTVVTGAHLKENCLPYEGLRKRLQCDDGPCLLLFGTGWGLTRDCIEACDYRLPGINAADPSVTYNHLPVRAAVAIILDRLLGQHHNEH
jgi:hypothetical protein